MVRKGWDVVMVVVAVWMLYCDGQEGLGCGDGSGGGVDVVL
jgi:hypothetical protein